MVRKLIFFNDTFLEQENKVEKKLDNKKAKIHNWLNKKIEDIEDDLFFEDFDKIARGESFIS